ncbi:P-loop containing nucleoside triphosphate hydrolase protein [Hymenopellis radicata]|nr:P-loop containing nucleoside triphosphate hydrolase protein [Hymenopellis radicata]
MPAFVSWNSPEGKAAVKRIVVKRIPDWTDGLHERQEEPTLLILDGKDVLLCTATGDGKSALFTVPILCHEEVSRHPEDYSNFRVRKHPVGLVITPTKGLAGDIVLTLAEHGITALAYDRQTISRANISRRNLIEEITCCTLFRVICIDPEHLHAPAWRKILDDTVFRSNLIYACLEEGHVAGEWGPTFRDAYNNIGTFLRGRLPSHVPVFSISATLEPGAPTTALCKILGFRAGSFTLFRYSNERQDLQFIIEPLEHGINNNSFPQLLPYLNTGRKVVIYAPTLEIVTKLYLYLFSMEPPGVNHAQRVRPYTALCEPEFNLETLSLAKTDPRLQIVLATIALANGVHIPSLDDSISLGMPSTLSQTEQQAGRASRPPDATGKAVVLVQKSDIKNAAKYLASLGASTVTTMTPTPVTGRKNKKKKVEFMDPAKAEVLTETICLVAAKNRRWQNPPIETTSLTCIEANRPLPCSLCAKREGISVTFPDRESVHPPFLTPVSKTSTPLVPAVLKLKKKERPIVVENRDLNESPSHRVI